MFGLLVFSMQFKQYFILTMIDIQIFIVILTQFKNFPGYLNFLLDFTMHKFFTV